MTSTTVRRAGAILVWAILLSSLAVASPAAPATAKPTCHGQPATIVGTPGDDAIIGTRGRDVIVAGRGNDRIRAQGGRDIICGGPGHDRIHGQGGRDLIFGGPGADRIRGGRGPDRLFGDAGQDDLDGGKGRDVCRHGPVVGPLAHCEVVTRFEPRDFAIAWSDLDGDHRYGPGDVLISRLFDTNGDGIPSAGDTVFMDRYPIDFEMTGFAEWGVASHVVEYFEWDYYELYGAFSVHVPRGLMLWRETRDEVFAETGSHVSESHGSDGSEDELYLAADSLSKPRNPINLRRPSGQGEDDGFIDVVLYPLPRPHRAASAAGSTTPASDPPSDHPGTGP